jgi:hypothetical protein
MPAPDLAVAPSDVLGKVRVVEQGPVHWRWPRLSDFARVRAFARSVVRKWRAAR